jgi:hypothetical protein
MQASVYGQNDDIGKEVKEYIEEISREVGLDTAFAWDGDEVLVAPG